MSRQNPRGASRGLWASAPDLLSPTHHSCGRGGSSRLSRKYSLAPRLSASRSSSSFSWPRSARCGRVNSWQSFAWDGAGKSSGRDSRLSSHSSTEPSVWRCRSGWSTSAQRRTCFAWGRRLLPQRSPVTPALPSRRSAFGPRFWPDRAIPGPGRPPWNNFRKPCADSREGTGAGFERDDRVASVLGIVGSFNGHS